MSPTGNRALILTRQSRTVGDSVSLEDQEAHARKWAAEHDYLVVGAITMPNTRGWKEERADHAEARRLAAAREIDVVVAYDVSRAARSVRILEQFVHDLAKHGVRLELSNQPWANSTVGRQLLSVFAELETTQKRDRQSDLWSHLMLNRGRWHGGEPFGYVRAGGGIIPNPDEAPTVVAIYDLALSGIGSGRAIANELNRRGVPARSGGRWWGETVLKILRSPVYAGGVAGKYGVRWPPDGESWHLPLIDRESWERVQAIQTHTPIVRGKSERSWLEGLVDHEACGSRMYFYTPLQKHGDTRQRIPLFRCQTLGTPHPCARSTRPEASGRNVQTAAMTALVRDLESAIAPERAQEALRASQREQGVDVALASLAKRRAAVLSRRTKAETLYLSGRRDRDWFDVEDDRIATLLAELDAEERQLPTAIDPADLSRKAEALTALGDAVAALADQDPSALGLVLREVGVRLMVSTDGVRWRWPSPIDRLIPEADPVKIPRARAVLTSV